MIDLTVKLFADGADLDSIRKLSADPLLAGFTTNPTLMRKAGVTDYEAFAREFLEIVPDRPISFEIFADDEVEMERQARKIAAWGVNVFVKIPITTTNGSTTYALVRRLADRGVQQNVTALLTVDQVAHIVPALMDGPRCYVSVFAGRIADAGRDPLPIMEASLALLGPHPAIELIWASPREVYNLVQANDIGCHVITMTHDLLTKIPTIGKDLAAFSLDTVRMFYNDALASRFEL
jgi:transaldolase